MRILILSDIHGNLAALEAVLEDAGEIDATWCLGDIVGYGPSPNECVDRVRRLSNLICILGNHDAAAVGGIPLGSFNYEARASIEWLSKNLGEEAAAYLKELPTRSDWEIFTLVHASPRQPLLEYLLDTTVAGENFEHFESEYCLVGHTHIPMLFKMPPRSDIVSLESPPPSGPFLLEPRSIINPGSVGQPRDHDPRASYSILDSENLRWEFHRVDYDIQSVQQLMLAADLPERNIIRLETGW